MRITALSSPLYVIGAETPSGKHKLFQIICRKDGSLFVPFPYYKYASAQLIEGTFKANQSYANGLTVSGPVAINRVKYAHHLDGEAHFSQDGQIRTSVRKRANSLQDHGGHLFTFQIQGLQDFSLLSDADLRKQGRRYVFLRYSHELTSLKIVAHLYSMERFKSAIKVTASNSSAWFRMCVEGMALPAVLLATRQSDLQLLTLSFEEIPPVSPKTESILTFIGGFDHPTLALDHSKDCTFLMLISPAGENPRLAAEALGTVDLGGNSGTAHDSGGFSLLRKASK
jgi:hypothetical protein